MAKQILTLALAKKLGAALREAPPKPLDERQVELDAVLDDIEDDIRLKLTDEGWTVDETAAWLRTKGLEVAIDDIRRSVSRFAPKAKTKGAGRKKPVSRSKGSAPPAPLSPGQPGIGGVGSAAVSADSSAKTVSPSGPARAPFTPPNFQHGIPTGAGSRGRSNGDQV